MGLILTQVVAEGMQLAQGLSQLTQSAGTQ